MQIRQSAKSFHYRYRHKFSLRDGNYLDMLRLTVIFFVIAAVAGIFGFGEVDGAIMFIAKAIFFLSLVLFILSLFVLPQRRH
jgi:uncharacterized membrane protein YtjA (UPF0391 family)